jgi:hypothetical protein
MRFVAVDDNIMAEGVTVLTVFMDDETGSSVRGWLAKITIAHPHKRRLALRFPSLGTDVCPPWGVTITPSEPGDAFDSSAPLSRKQLSVDAASLGARREPRLKNRSLVG